MSDDELDEKLDEFKGPIRTFDDETRKKLGTLMLDPLE